MKKTILLLLISIIAIFLILWYLHDLTFVEHNFKEYTKISDGYVKKMEFYNDSESYIEVLISNNQKRGLLQRCNFSNNLIYTTQVPCDWITPDENHLYFFYKTKGFQFILFSLEKNGNNLIVYQDFGDN